MTPRVLILMAAYNGERFLEEQLASIAAQTVPAIDMLVSDDGSTDGTLAMLRDWQQRWRKGTFDIISGPRSGFADNFRHLILSAPEGADYVGFSDQDDLWDTDKIEAAIAALQRAPADKPVLYGGRTRLIDAFGRPIGLSPLFKRPPSFRNALVQSIAGGNTMLFNQAGFALMRESSRRTSFLMHDWWAYLIVSGAGGTVVYDREPHLRYRQHATNAVGGKRRLLAQPHRLLELLGGDLIHRTDCNLRGLNRCHILLSKDSVAELVTFSTLRHAGLTSLRLLRPFRFYRQTAVGNLGLLVATVLRRI